MKDAATAWLSQEIPWYAGEQLKMDGLTGEALWHRDGEAPLPMRWVLLRDPSGKRSPFALLCTDPTVAMLQIITWYVLRWNIEVTFQEARAHLGLCTQRQWSTPAIARTTPCLLGLFSLVVLMAYTLHAFAPADPANGLVFQSRTHLCRCPRGGSPPSVGPAEFANPTRSFGVRPFVRSAPRHAH